MELLVALVISSPEAGATKQWGRGYRTMGSPEDRATKQWKTMGSPREQ